MTDFVDEPLPIAMSFEPESDEKAVVRKRNNTARRRGASWEAEITSGFRDAGMDCERTRNSGTKDQGDHVIRSNGQHFVIEAKNKAKYEPQAWLREAIEEAENYRAKRGLDASSVHPAVCMKVRGKGFGGSAVLLPVAEYIRLMKGYHDGGAE